MINSRIRSILADVGKLAVPVEEIGDDSDLYAAGLTSFASVQLMLALEDAFDVEFPESMLNRASFKSIEAIASMLAALNVSTI